MTRLSHGQAQIQYHNDGARLPLVFNVDLICNTPDEKLHANIRTNSARMPRNWLAHHEPHDGVAILCGSGPSLGDDDHLDDLRWHQQEGHKIFAMNGSARFLFEQGVMPDYQVIVDARQETAALIGPARQHLFASQVHPDCFRRVPSAILWHLQVDWIDDDLPEDSGMLCLIGGGASVGNCAVCVAYELGYRTMHCYGYDSSHRHGRGHAFPQPLNDDDPYCIVEYNGKSFTSSLTMKLQAEKFQETSYVLKGLGCRIEVHGDGLLPEIYNQPPEVISEAEKYRRMWEVEEYREFSPGARVAERFLELVKPDGLIIDFGCGTGAAARVMAEAGHDVQLIDLVDNAIDEKNTLPFMVHDLCQPLPLTAPYGFCSDVMEHIPPLDVEMVITNIMKAAHTVFFQICTVHDKWGAQINQYLHLTVKPHVWWLHLFERMGYRVSWSEEQHIAALFIVHRE